MSEQRTLAATNNAAWCDVVCRSHGLVPTLAADAWASRTRTPPLYPDAVTLVPDVAVPDLLARIDVSAGCSIKDSFASLDLTAYGFRTLFEAEWIAAPRGHCPAPIGDRWKVVRDRETFNRWEQVWRGDEGQSGVLLEDLLDNDSVAVLAACDDGEVVSGAILYRSAEVVGISNFFTKAQLASASWAECASYAATVCPGARLVGYETGERLDLARAHGFESFGPLRVWHYDA